MSTRAQQHGKTSLAIVVPLLLCVVLLATSGCVKVAGKVKSQARAVGNRIILRPAPLDLTVALDPAANRNSPVALDLVLIKDKNFWKTAPSLTAKDWFARKSDLQRQYRDHLQVTSWEWVPGQPVAPVVVKVPRRFAGAMIFADYPSPGTHSAPVPLGGAVSISLQQNDFTMEVKK
ncbi:MAG TPA: hypothetical protein VFP59_17955 [Candidatus Angelobacter sp.]|nr:hypothetical protein [Candidatus Angelobacter sp.]